MSDGSNRHTPGWVSKLADSPWVEPVLGALVAIFGIATAAVAYQASIYGGNSNENFFTAQSDLSDSSFFYDQANQTVQKDFDILTEIDVQTALNAPDAAINALKSSLSEEAQASFKRSNDFDDQYYNDLYATPEAYEQNAQEAYKAAKAWDDLGDSYELLGLILAVGLGFVGWAGLLGRESVVRYAFAALAVLALILGIILASQLLSRPIPTMVTPLSAQTSQ